MAPRRLAVQVLAACAADGPSRRMCARHPGRNRRRRLPKWQRVVSGSKREPFVPRNAGDATTSIHRPSAGCRSRCGSDPAIRLGIESRSRPLPLSPSSQDIDKRLVWHSVPLTSSRLSRTYPRAFAYGSINIILLTRQWRESIVHPATRVETEMKQMCPTFMCCCGMRSMERPPRGACV